MLALAYLFQEVMRQARQKKGPMYKVVEDELGVEGLRERLSGMGDSELLRFGWFAKYACSRDGGPAERDREPNILELYEARQEWNRRKKRLPLRGSF
jgi:hypothetical protein